GPVPARVRGRHLLRRLHPQHPERGPARRRRACPARSVEPAMSPSTRLAPESDKASRARDAQCRSRRHAAQAWRRTLWLAVLAGLLLAGCAGQAPKPAAGPTPAEVRAEIARRIPANAADRDGWAR